MASLESFVTRLQDESLELSDRYSVLSELCDTLETYSGAQEYEQFLKNLMPVFFQLLDSVPISMISNSPEQKVRHLVLDVIHRLPINDTFQSYTVQVLDKLMNLIREENEENGIQCMKIIASLHKSYKSSLADRVQAFIDILQEIYNNIPQVVEEQFGDQSDSSPPEKAGSPGSMELDENTSKTLFKATHSFKMIAECPITMVSLYSSYKEIIDSSVASFIPQVITLLRLQAKKQQEAHEAAKERGEYVTGVSREIHNRSLYGDFILGQVKAASFLAYVLIRRGANAALEPYLGEIPDLIIRLLQDCPPELATARRELLHATRHILSTDLRVSFLPKMDLLFDDRVIIGEGLTAHETLRPLAYSIVADFIHVNGNLSTDRIWKSVELYCDHLQDTTLAQTVHIMSAKLLLNLVDRVLKLEDKEEARQLFLIMINAFVKRFALLNRQYTDIMQQHDKFTKKKDQKRIEGQKWRSKAEELTGKSPFGTEEEKPEKKDTKPMEVDEEPEYTFYEIQRDVPINVTQPPPQDPLESARYLLKTLMTFLKSIFYGFRNCNPAPQKDYTPQTWNEFARITSNEEINILKNLFRECILGLRFFQSSKPMLNSAQLKETFDVSGPNLPITSSKEEKDLMEIFATMFIYLEPSAFNEVTQSQLEMMFESMLKNAALLHIPQFFLASETTTSNFSGILIIFVMSKLNELGDMDIIKSNILIRLFKLCFMSVNLFQAANEAVILPHLNKLILKSLEYTTSAKEPIVYFYLIRTLFRSIGGGRFEALYKEILPLLQVLLESLNRLIQTARRPQERDIYVELCLTVPVRLSVLVPHLSYLMKPLVYALNGSQELISQGLRTLELCVDNLTAEYFDPILEPVIEDVMKALWKHLRPLPYYHQHSHTTFRLLGKLGGRNHNFISLHHDLQGSTPTNQEIEALFKIEGLPKETPVSITPGISTALNTIVNIRYKLHYRVSAFKYLTSVLKLFIDRQEIPDNLDEKIQQVINYVTDEEKSKEVDEEVKLGPGNLKDQARFDRQEQLLIRLLEALFYSVSIEEVREEAEVLIKGICEHYVLLFFGRTMVDAHKFNCKFSVNNHEGKKFLNENTIFDAISYALSFHIKSVHEMGIQAVKTIFNSCVTLFGSIDGAIKFLPIRRMCSKFVHCCFEEAYYTKLGGCLGLKTMINDLNIPISYFALRQLEICRAMFFVLRDTPPDVPSEVCRVAKELALKLLRECNREVSKDAVFQQPFQSVVSQIVFDLSNSNPKVRETAQEALSTLSEVTQVPIATMISPSKGILLAPIFGKPLRALPFHMQIGNIDAITFCLGLEDTFLEFNDELNRLLSEALALVDADDESLISAHRISEHRTSEQLIKLRVVCIELLSLALTKPAFSNGNPQIRIRILGVFFKTLCAKSSQIINAAHAGLKQVLSQNSKLPKELLQSGLRPMLMNLSDHKKLTVSGLEALSRLLELLISYFKVEIGRKLLDHLMAWAQPQALQRIALQELDNNSTVQIIVAILNIFHLLPPQAYTFMEELLNTLFYLETNLRRYQSSPFRLPIAKFLNRFGDHSVTYFSQKFDSRIHGCWLAYFSGLKDAPELRNQVKSKLDVFVKSVVEEQQPNVRYIKFANLVDLVEAIGNQDREWFKEQKDLFRQLFDASIPSAEYQRTCDLKSDSHFIMEQTLDKLQTVYVDFLRTNELGAKETLELISFVSLNKITISYSLEKYTFETVVKSTDLELRQTYIKEILETLNTDVCLIAKLYLLRNILLPTLIYELHFSGTLTNIVNNSWLSLVDENIWKSSLSGEETGPYDNYRLELLQLTALLERSVPEAVLEYKKDVIKFNWNLISLDDAITKQAAYVSTAFFIVAFDTPAKLVTQIFVALLRANQIDVRYLVRQALDILAPVLETRIGPTIEWLKWPRRVLSEDGFNVTQVLNVYQFIVHHSDLFYVARDQFIPNIITAVGKLTILNNSSTENQLLAIDMGELILNWETRAKAESKDETKEGDDKMDVDEDVKKPESYSVPFGQRETCITFLIRYVCISQHRASENELGQRALNILHVLLSPNYWPEVTVKLAFFERFLVAADFSTSNVLGYCLNALEVLGVALEWKSPEWIVSNLEYLQKLLEKCIRSDNHDIQEALQKVLGLILGAIQTQVPSAEDEQPEEVKNFLAFYTNVISEDLNSMNSVAAGVTLSWTLSQYRPDAQNALIPLIMRTLSKLVKDHIAIASQNRHFNNNSTEPSAVQTDYEAKMTTKLLKKILQFSAMRISALGDQRRIFLSLLVQLIDRSVDKDLLMRIVDIARGWVFAKNELFPTTKENAGILSKMMIFEMKGDSDLARAFYQIIIDIFKDSALAGTELTVRMEHPFLVGTKLSDTGVRQELMNILDGSLERDLDKRLFYIIREQNWEYLAEYPWLNQASQLLYGSFDAEHPLSYGPNEYKLAALSDIDEALPKKSDVESVPDSIKSFVNSHREFLNSSIQVRAKDVLVPLMDISYQSPETIHNSWCTLFPIAYNSIDHRNKSDFLHAFVTLLSKDYHVRQQDGKPNVIHTMLEAAEKCPDLQLPPHLVKYLGLNYDAWYSGVKIMEQIESNPVTENQKIKETNRDALVEMYSNLQEDDMFYGLWRRRAKYFETNSALSYEQIGLWDKALQLYENAQIKARSGVLPYSESEYALWEDNWILCAEKLQHWDILTELAKHEGFTDLLLECGWRVADWISDREPLEQSVKTVMDVPTPRRQMFQTFLCLQGYAHSKETIQNVTRYCDEGIQLALRKWHSLPTRITGAHLSLLHIFQQYVEFMEASQVYRSLATTTAQNLDVKSQELKRVLQAWRERLPNVWDDINIWNDLVTWRQHAFNVINKVYMPLIPALQQNNSNNNSYAFRGYHEIAWVINRFAHVARKHNMPEVCINQLTKIYTLPNIEIQEAFLKLREQAKCHYQNPAELSTGLDVISNTNLVYFAAQQKAEFITLKGMFLAKLNSADEANQAFATAVQLDLNLPKAWAEWGFFNDARFKENNDISYAKHAISCYLQAAGLYKNSKARRLLCRILWLISLDDANGTLAETFESHQGDMPVWHWITFIPQLLTSLSHREARLARHVLIRIAKSYPQALHFQLRTTKEDFAVLQRQMNQRSESNGADAPTSPEALAAQPTGSTPIPGNSSSPAPSAASGANPQPWQHVEEIMGILKTAYPLLALSLESLVDQISQRFKSSHDDDAYRLVVALYNDGVQYFNRLSNPKEDARLPPATEANIIRFADTVLPKHIREEFDQDIIKSKPNLETYISKLRKWKDFLEEKLDRNFGKMNLERVCPHLSQFHHQKFEEIEIPGQYLLNKESNNHFVKIERFLPTLEFIRGPTACYKRITIRGHDGSLHPFAVQFPAARHCRREERIFQLFRIFNDALSKNVQARRRNIELTLPVAIPLSPHIRIMSDSEDYVNMLSIYEDYCRKNNQNKDQPFAYTIEKLHAAYDPRLPKPDLLSVKTEILAAIQSMLVPSTVMKDYFMAHYTRFEEFWLFRKQFTSQYAAFIFMTYMLCINSRQPQKIHVNQSSGRVWTSEMLPYKVASGKTHSNAFANSTLDVSAQRAAPLFCSLEMVPFRLTPNVQKLIGEAGMEGILSAHIMVIAQCLSDPEYEMEHFLSLFVRDEVVAWFTQQHRPSAGDPHLREIVRVNVNFVSKRVAQLSHTEGQGIASQFILNLIAHAVNPRNLASTDTLWMAYM